VPPYYGESLSRDTWRVNKTQHAAYIATALRVLGRAYIDHYALHTAIKGQRNVVDVLRDLIAQLSYLGIVGSWQEYNELVTTVACDQIAGARAALERIRDSRYHAISLLMPEALL
jgi:hypothetical protein